MSEQVRRKEFTASFYEGVRWLLLKLRATGWQFGCSKPGQFSFGKRGLGMPRHDRVCSNQ